MFCRDSKKKYYKSLDFLGKKYIIWVLSVWRICKPTVSFWFWLYKELELVWTVSCLSLFSQFFTFFFLKPKPHFYFIIRFFYAFLARREWEFHLIMVNYFIYLRILPVDYYLLLTLLQVSVLEYFVSEQHSEIKNMSKWTALLISSTICKLLLADPFLLFWVDARKLISRKKFRSDA